MQTLSDIAPYVALGAAALALVLLVLVVVLMTRVARLRRAQTVVLGRHEQRDLVAHTEDLDAQVRNLREAVEILSDELDAQKRHLDRALTNRAIMRYDAFRDAGGEQSASFALLDQYRSGVVLSAIAARDFARIYVKHVTEGVPDRDLSPEEAQVIELAVPKPLAPGAEGSRARRAPLPEARPPAGLPPLEPPARPAEADPGGAGAGAQAGPGGPETGGAAGPAGAEAPASPGTPAPSPAAAAAFESLGDAVAPGAAGDADAPSGDDFTWEPPPQRPQGGSSSRR